MRPLNTILITLGIAASGYHVQAAHLQAHLQFSARLDGMQEVPAVTTDGMVVASLTLNATRDTLCILGHFNGLSGPIMGLHIHDGVAGVNGPVLVDLTDMVAGNRLQAQLTGSAITPEIIAAHVRGELYLNVHTAMHPNGEIRGQIVPETDIAMVADLSGMQEVPPVMTDGSGMATFQLAKHGGMLSYRVVINGLSGPIQAAHLHSGPMGQNGGVVLDLGGDIMGNTIVGMADPTTFLPDLLMGNIYLNVHTAMHPNGEIRGQLMAVEGVPFDAWLDGDQEVPAVATMAKGVASIMLSADLSMAMYDVRINGLSGPIAAAHLHLGDPGQNGGVILDLEAGIMGSERIMGSFNTSGLGDMLITQLLRGEVYINVHTAMNPNGEIRGQVYRYMREGYTVDANGAQEVPMNMSMATGGGIVTVDRDQSNAHIMLVTDASMTQAAHLHEAAMGVNGPVIYDLGPSWVDNAVFTYWTGMDANTPFAVANSVQLRNDMLYLNIHTMDFPNGELRGQVKRGPACAAISTGIADGSPSHTKLEVYPVPADEQVTVMLGDNSVTNLMVLDAMGRQVAVPQHSNASGRIVLRIVALPAGYYTLMAIGENGVSTARFIRK
ncbi:MAG: CHRD domain-containing protein [Flavobacteriales bacterium]